MMWKTKGMNQDLSVSAFNPEFAFENMNLRISTNEGNTMMSWVNEKGTKQLSLGITMIHLEYWSKEGEEDVYIDPHDDSWTYHPANSDITDYILGIPVGTAILNKYLVLFTHDGSVDRIYRLEHIGDTTDMEGKTLFSGNLNLSFDHPIETLVSYESETIQKVYWTDGYNQPRIINIAPDNDDKIGNYNDNSFDFVKKLKLNETIIVKKKFGISGIFAPGVIQYAFTYYSKYGQESSIFYTSPLLYISHKDRGGSPEDRIENAFKITINNVDTDFDYIRIYSIQRTSIDGTPICKRVQDISTKNLDWVNDANPNLGKKAVYTDTGTSGDSIDPTELLYKGGEVVTVGTMESKDNTLFMGNLKIKRESISKELKDKLEDAIEFTSVDREFVPETQNSTDYQYENQLSSVSSEPRHNGMTVPCGGFRGGDYYRCGVQFQHETGKWSEPIHIPVMENNVKSDFKVTGNSAYSPGQVTVRAIKGTLTDNSTDKIFDTLKAAGYKRMRPVVVFPGPIDRNIVCQGVIAPTVYTQKQRGDNSLFAQASWFFRPYISTEGTSGDIDPTDTAIAPKSQAGPLEYTYYGTDYDKEHPSTLYPSTSTKVYSPDHIRRVEIEGQYDDNSRFQIDRKLRTLHSPDLEFDDQMLLYDYASTKYQYVGYAAFERTFSDIDIQTETPTISSNATGFVHDYGTSFNQSGNAAKGIVSGLFYEDALVDDDDDPTEFKIYEKMQLSSTVAKWLIYPWQSNGSLTDDINRPASLGTSTSTLKKKVISNLRYANTTYETPSSGVPFGNLSPQLFSSDENTIIKFNYGEGYSDCIYRGNIDVMLIPDNYDGKYFALEGIEYNTSHPISIYDWRFTGTETPFNSSMWLKTFSGGFHSDSTTFPPKDPFATIRLWTKNETWSTYTNWWYTADDDGFFGNDIGNMYMDMVLRKNPVRMKYKTTPHLLCKFPPISGSDTENPLQESDNQLKVVNILKDTDKDTRFGGMSQDALKENTWLPCGEPVSLPDSPTDNTHTELEFYYDYGDTYYQRWDCLKTYAFTPEDINQVVEIGSFMLETRVNIDGRYDRNRGQINNLNMSKTNFNLLNPVYSQKDNFFNYKLLDEDYYENVTFPNQITWSKTKNAGADTDLWTNVTLASILEMDGDKGGVSKLIRFNDQLLCFQDSGLSQILYNERMQMSTVQGVPVELGNSAKVDGKRYLSDTVGCRNKWSVVNGAAGIYFMDSHEKSIYLFNGQLNNLSVKLGFNAWCKNNITNDIWKPQPFTGFISYYDKKNQEVLFINDGTALAYSEKLGVFTSFYDYGGAPFFCNLDDTGIWIKDSILWKHQAGDYCDFFGTEENHNYKPYYMTLIGNPEPQLDKTFTNLEFRAYVDGDGQLESNEKFTFFLPFDSLETWDEYQHGCTVLSNKSGHSAMVHGGDDSTLKRKFRIWRCDIPRNNCLLDDERPTPDTLAYSKDSDLNISRYIKKPLDRMRNPWLYLKLWKSSDTNKKTEIHDVVMTYYN